VAKLIEEKTIEIAPLAFMRGRTLSNAFVMLDEAQNATTMQMKMFLTRLGEGSRMVITGDRSQVDLPIHWSPKSWMPMTAPAGSQQTSRASREPGDRSRPKRRGTTCRLPKRWFVEATASCIQPGWASSDLARTRC
jgi:hypothetical protein